MNAKVLAIGYDERDRPQYIYNPNVIHVNEIYEIYTTSEYWSAFPRSPMVIDFDFMLR